MPLHWGRFLEREWMLGKASDLARTYLIRMKAVRVYHLYHVTTYQSPPTQLSITDNPRPRPQCGILAPGPAVMTGITRPLTSIKTVNTLLITELTCPENWSLIFPSISANLSCLCWSDTNWSWTSARSGINDKLCSKFKQHWQFDRRAIKHDTFSLSLWCCSGSWSDATFLIWFFRSVKYFQFPWRDDMQRIDNGISSMWSLEQRDISNFIGQDVGYGWCI